MKPVSVSGFVWAAERYEIEKQKIIAKTKPTANLKIRCINCLRVKPTSLGTRYELPLTLSIRHEAA